MMEAQSKYEIGHVVRIYDSCQLDSIARVGTIAYINQQDQTCDIIFNPSKTTAQESNAPEIERDGVLWSLMKPLEPFEYLAFESKRYDASPFKLKEQGNVIFGLRDYDKAAELYIASLELLDKSFGSLSIGSEVIVQMKPNALEFYNAMIVSIEDDDQYEVEFDDIIETDEDYGHIICKSQIAATVYPDDKPSKHGQETHKNRLLQRSLYTNLSRCCVKRNRQGWAVRWISLAMAITRSLESKDDCSADVILKYKQDELFIRCRAFITAYRLELAEKDALRLASLQYPKASQLLREIKRLKEQKRASNRRLVNEVMKWVDSSMASVSMYADLPIADEI